MSVLGMSASEYRRRHRLAPDAHILPHLDVPTRQWIAAARRRTRAILEGGIRSHFDAARQAVRETRSSKPEHTPMSQDDFLKRLMEL
ncbi:hypothetical protein [Tautonia plasticadhaerens]|uniref:hypothetical protein n=1 Tax=Tautonia plasticadhaerens TaxID=2527974 RepID=UPI0011A67115|nr:hypothetical protein [Tautonia plasticadhaerens]